MSERLLDFIPKCDPKFVAPYHLADFCDVLERAPRGDVRALCSVPIRHHKTWTCVCAIVKWLKEDPTLNVVYMSYDKRRVEDVCKEIRDLARNMGIKEVRDFNTILNWRTEEGGGVAGFSTDQSRLGSDVDILIWDDPYSGPEQAADPRQRQLVSKHIDFYTNRLMPHGSCVGIMSRFDLDDAMGEREQRAHPKWETIYHKAIEVNADGEDVAFAPHVFTLEELRAKRAELLESDPQEITWWSQWQNTPKSLVSSSFREPVRWHYLPASLQYFIGLDMSWSSSKRSDKTALVVLAKSGTTQYVVDVVSMDFDFEAIESTIRDAKAKYPGRVFSYMSGPEKSIVKWAQFRNIGIIPMTASDPKFVRARNTIDRWNAGAVQIPVATFFPSGMRVDKFIALSKTWTGNENQADDEIDALVSASDAGLSFTGGPPKAVGQRRMR